ncbi:MAG: 4-hydroxyphenylacetate 3-hydroxylase N-terminal domain-containing protein [Bdellovibrionales bacterium]
MVKTASEYLEGLKSTPLRIWYKGERTPPLQVEKLRRQAVVVADYFQHHHERPDVNIVSSQADKHSVTLLIARNRDDLRRKSECFYSLAKNYLGIVGRPPDYINAVFSTWAGCSSLFGDYAVNVANYHREMAANDYFVTHSTSELKGGPKTGIRVVAERDDGVVLSGARAMATSAAVSDEMFIAPTRINDEELDKAIVCAIPTHTQGLNLICRQNFDSGSDLSAYFDESDALVVLDKVFVPWERVFIYRDLNLYKSIVKTTGTVLAASLQTNTRAIAKLESLIELMLAWKEIYPKYHSTGFGQTAGAALRDLQILKALQFQAIENSKMVNGCMQADGEAIEAAKFYFMESYPKIIAGLRADMGPELFYLFDPEDIDRGLAEELCAQWGIDHDAFEARQKVSKVLFDLLIATFGVRHELYEQFYAGNPKNGISNYWNAYGSAHRGPHFFEKLRQVSLDYLKCFEAKQSVFEPYERLQKTFIEDGDPPLQRP